MSSQRKPLAEALFSLANIVAGAMVFGQFIAGQGIDVGVMLRGALFTIIFYISAYNIAKEKN